MNPYHHGTSYMGAPPVAPPRQSSLCGGSTRLEPNSHRTSESSSISYDSSRRSSNDSSKPRLSKDQQSFLEREFSINQKPRRETKMQFADRIGVSVDKVNNWFQNKRAKTRNDEKKQHNQQLAYQLYQGSSLPDSSHPPLGVHYPSAFTDNSMDPHSHHFQYAYPTSGHFDHHDGSMEPSLDAANLMPDEGLYTHFNFGDQPQHQERFDMNNNDDPMSSFFGLSGPVPSMEDLQQQQHRFGNPSMMAPISEEAEEPQQDRPAPPPNPPVQSQETNANLNDFVDPANFEMPFNHYDYPSYGQNATWGASAGGQEHTYHAIYQDYKPSASISHQAELPYRSASPPQDQATNSTHMQAFHQPQHTSFYSQPTLPSQHDQYSTMAGQRLAVSTDLNQRKRLGSLQDNFSPTSPNAPRRDSAVSNLADNVHNADVQGASSTNSTAPQVPVPGPSAPVSKKQRRPAPLTTNTARSTLTGSTVPASPRNANMDANLRRIKSSNNSAGRVQKSNASSAQRSPLNANFNHAEFSRTISSQSMTNLGEAWRRGSTVPITPTSPDEGFMSASSNQVPPKPQIQHAQYNTQMVPMDEQQSASGPLSTIYSHGPLDTAQNHTLTNQMSPPETPSHTMQGFPQSNQQIQWVSQQYPQTRASGPGPLQHTSFDGSHQQPQLQRTQNMMFRDQQQTSNADPPERPDTGNDKPSQSRHIRTATAQYVGPQQPQSYPHQTVSTPFLPTPVFGSPLNPSFSHHEHFGFHHNAPSHADSTMQQDSTQRTPHHTNVLPPAKIQQAPPTTAVQTTSSPRRASGNHHVQPEPPRPPSNQQNEPPKPWPYNSRFKPPMPEAFNTWSLHDQPTREGNTEPIQQEKQYTFVPCDGGNNAGTPDRQAPKSAGLPSSYSKIEFLNTSPQAFREATSATTSPVQG